MARDTDYKDGYKEGVSETVLESVFKPVVEGMTLTGTLRSEENLKGLEDGRNDRFK